MHCKWKLTAGKTICQVGIHCLDREALSMQSQTCKAFIRLDGNSLFAVGETRSVNYTCAMVKSGDSSSIISIPWK